MNMLAALLVLLLGAPSAFTPQSGTGGADQVARDAAAAAQTAADSAASDAAAAAADATSALTEAASANTAANSAADSIAALPYDWAADSSAVVVSGDWVDISTLNGYQALASLGTINGGKVLRGVRTTGVDAPQGFCHVATAGDFTYMMRVGFASGVGMTAAQLWDVLATYVDGDDVKNNIYRGGGWSFATSNIGVLLSQVAATPTTYMNSGTPTYHAAIIPPHRLDFAISRSGDDLRLYYAQPGGPFQVLAIWTDAVGTGAGRVCFHVNSATVSTNQAMSLYLYAFRSDSSLPQ